MQGFKSFADKTELVFDEQIVGVVGPNGCGKSNIVDAIRWAMGEQSAKGLRGKEMSDVIFAGTPARKASGLAEVSLVFDNSDHQAPAPYTDCAEIMITRRLYRSGESDYLINLVTVRLKDIHDLFLGTGSSAKAYSIVAQGKVDEVVLAKPEDRRFLIEEAAGIAKYKIRKQSAERKMEATQQNLDRVNDLLRELEKNSKNLERQVEKAEKFRSLQSELKAKECDWIAARLKRLDESAVANQEALQSAQDALTEKQSRLAEIEAKIETLRLESLQYEKITAEDYESLMSTKDQLARLDTERELAQQKMELLNNQIAERRSDVARLGSKFENQEGSRQQLQAELERRQQERQQADQKLRELQAARDQAEDRLKDTQANLERISEVLQAHRSELAVESQQLKMKRAELVDIELYRAGLESRLEVERQEIKSLEIEDHSFSEDLQTKLDELRVKKEEEQDLSGRREQLLKERESLLAELSRLDSGCIEKEAAIKSLKQLEQHALGYDGMALELKKQTGLELLMDQVKFRPEAQDLGETLIYHLGQFFTESLADQALEARWTSLLLKAGSNRPERSLSSLLDESSSEQVKDLFSAIELVDEIDWESPTEFCQLDRKGGWRASLGASLELRSFGKVSREQSPFSRHHEIIRSEQELSELRQELGAMQARVEDNLQRQEELRKNLEKTQLARQEIEQKLEALRQDRELILQQKAGKNALAEELSEEIQKTEEKIAKKNGEILSLPELKSTESMELELAEARQRLAEAKNQLDERDADWVEYRIECGALQERLERIQQQFVSLDMAQSEYKHNQGLYQKDIELWEQEIHSLRQNVKDWAERGAQEREKVQSLEKGLAKSKDQVANFRRDLEELEKSRREWASSKEELVESLQALELEKQRFSLELEEINRSLEERYEISAQQLLSSLSEEDLESLASSSLEEMALEVKALRERLSKFGDVNLVALTEYEEMKSRVEFMNTQREDLLGTLSSLQSIIDRINRISEFRFRETFNAINHNFQLLFPKLFGGGKAFMRLTDESQLLETGVEIFAEPPGKKIQAMSLLSGGEKAMTSISLLFSLFAYRPSSFCILDEVDAPLDDINTRRYNEIIREMSSLSQFIVVTHNKRTMEAASTLFGVTMQEPGCSRIVGVNLTEAKAFTTAAAEA
ncbi:MAG: hypothetical protein EA369_03825 [Bradymonadales bacterium]|nr:MAG: hypothetical protein EA369_03825 [Bradymonadales bacterium]